MRKISLLLIAIGLAYALYRITLAPPVTVEISAPSAQAQTVPGVYTANRDDATDILELKDDGSYARNYRPAGGTTLIHQGQWTRDGDRITFTNFAIAPERDAAASDAWRTSRQTWTTRISIGRSEVQIVINADGALIYSKRGE
ncbi:MAG: hypothetical protein ACK4NA_14400 [Alphaproteobacteria bacterium]